LEELLVGMGFGLADFVKVRDGTSSSSPGLPGCEVTSKLMFVPC